MQIRISGLRRSLMDLDADALKVQEIGLRTNALQLFADLRRATPVDTGNARRSWNISYNERFVDTSRATAGTYARTTIFPRKVPTTIYITNGVPYINRLNQGSSRQAPSNFIETAVLSNFDTITGGSV